MATAALAGASILGSVMQYKSLEAQNEYSSRMDAINQRRSEIQAQDALSRGEKEYEKYTSKVKGVVGSQKASMAAQGIRLDSGSAADIISETETLGYEDALQIKNNAFREALGYRVQQADRSAESALYRSELKGRQFQTIINTGMQAARTYASYKQPAKG